MNRHEVKALCLGYIKHHHNMRTVAIWRFVNKLIEKGWLSPEPWKNTPDTMRNLMRDIEQNNEFLRYLMDKYETPV